jgi:hypothetical protein
MLPEAVGAGLLDHAGKVSAESARAKTEMEDARYRRLADALPRAVDEHFEQAVKELEKVRKLKKGKQPKR